MSGPTKPIRKKINVGEADMKPGLRSHWPKCRRTFGCRNSGGRDTPEVVVMSVVYQDAVLNVPADEYIVVEIALEGLLAQFFDH